MIISINYYHYYSFSPFLYFILFSFLFPFSRPFSKEYQAEAD